MPVEILTKLKAQQYSPEIYDDLFEALFERNEPDEYRYLAHALSAMEEYIKCGEITLRQDTFKKILKKMNGLEPDSAEGKLFAGRLSPEIIFPSHSDNLPCKMTEQSISR